MDDLKQRLTDWYNRNIVAGWYRSYALVGGWLVAAIAFIPDVLTFVSDYWSVLADFTLPSLSAQSKSLLLGFYVVFVAPPLRAWAQKKMREAALKQAEVRGDAIVIPPSAPTDPS